MHYVSSLERISLTFNFANWSKESVSTSAFKSIECIVVSIATAAILTRIWKAGSWCCRSGWYFQRQRQSWKLQILDTKNKIGLDYRIRLLRFSYRLNRSITILGNMNIFNAMFYFWVWKSILIMDLHWYLIEIWSSKCMYPICICF